MKSILIVLAIVLGSLASLPAFTAHAQTTGPGSYFCTKNPGAAQCQKPPTTRGGGTTGKQPGRHTKPPSTIPSTGAGGTYPVAGTGSVVTGLANSPSLPAQLPTTGGGRPVAPTGNGWLWLSALLALASGAGLRLAFARR
jgi:hypothetical protein